MEIVVILSIVFFAYSITPKTFQNDTFYTIKIGEHIQENMSGISDFLPGHKGLDLQDPFSFHKDLPYMYPHWLYDLITYKVYSINGFNSVYLLTCGLSIILGLSLYFINRKLNKSLVISFLVTIGSLYCLKDFIAARAQLVTFILFAFTIYNIEKFITTKKIRYVVALIIIPILIANIHSAVWPFYFVLYLPYIVEYFITLIATSNLGLLMDKITLKSKKKKISLEQYNAKVDELNKKIKERENRVESALNGTYKLNVRHEKNIKWLILIAVVCLFTGLFTPIKDMPYSYILRTEQGETTQNISEHLPLVLINNMNVIIILLMLLGLLTFTRTKIKIRDFFMLLGLIALSFITQRQVSMLVLVGNFILVRLICALITNFKNKQSKEITSYLYIVEFSVVIMFSLIMGLNSTLNIVNKRNNEFISTQDYPVGAADYILENIIPEVGAENFRLYNEYNYGSYLLYRGIPVFIDSRCDLYTEEFNGSKGDDGKYHGRDIFNDAMEISRLETDYEGKFREYGITHVITYANSKLKTELLKDSKYKQLYQDDYFIVFEKVK